MFLSLLADAGFLSQEQLSSGSAVPPHLPFSGNHHREAHTVLSSISQFFPLYPALLPAGSCTTCILFAWAWKLSTTGSPFKMKQGGSGKQAVRAEEGSEERRRWAEAWGSPSWEHLLLRAAPSPLLSVEPQGGTVTSWLWRRGDILNITPPGILAEHPVPSSSPQVPVLRVER